MPLSALPARTEAVDERQCENDARQQERPPHDDDGPFGGRLQTEGAENVRQDDDEGYRKEQEDDCPGGEGQGDRVQGDEAPRFRGVVRYTTSSGTLPP
jgi:hypothetical protein